MPRLALHARPLVWLTLSVGCGAPQAQGARECPAAPTPAPSASAAASASAPSAASAASPAPVDTTFLRTFAATRGFRLGTPKSPTPTPDGKAVLFLRSGPRDPRQSLFEIDVDTGATRELLAPDAVSSGPETISAAEKARRERQRIGGGGFTAFELSADGAKVLLSLSGRLLLLTRATGAWIELASGPGALDPRLSPDGTRVAYVRDHDVRVIATSAGAKEQTVTHGGTEAVPHGEAEFIAQEELGRRTGHLFSPDGRWILYEEADQSKVERISIVDLAHPEGTPERPYYPRAGKANAEVRFGLVPSGGGKTTWVDWDRARFPYVAHVGWSKDAPPVLYVLDRAQQRGQLLAIDAQTGKTSTLVEERDDAWLNVDPSCPRFLPDGSFLWSTERTGQWTLERRGRDGALLKTLVVGALGYRELLGVDFERGALYVAAAHEPTERQVFAVTLDGVATRLPMATPVAYPTFGRARGLLVGYEGSLDGGRAWVARSVDGKRVRELPSLAESPPRARVELLRVGPDETRVAVIRPASFVPGKRYPVVDAAYGGPHVATVTADGAASAREQWLADALGAIVVKIDAKGTPHRGRAWERAIKDALHRVPLEGHVAALRALAERVPEIDLARVGVFGWSFGGYLATLAVLDHPELFKVGVAGAPVVDWRDYDTAYTERYLGLPSENAAVYDAADTSARARRAVSSGVAPRPLLIFHGTADDNVYFSSSLKLAEALAKAERPYELVPLLGQTHMLSTAGAHELVWGRTIAFLRAHL